MELLTALKISAWNLTQNCHSAKIEDNNGESNGSAVVEVAQVSLYAGNLLRKRLFHSLMWVSVGSEAYPDSLGEGDQALTQLFLQAFNVEDEQGTLNAVIDDDC